MKETLPQSIEAILFATAEAETYARLASRLEVSIEDIAQAVQHLQEKFEGHGIELVVLNEVVSLVTKPAYSPLIEAIRKDDLSKELSKASAETLAVIAYLSQSTRSQIEFIRGVNVSYSLRSLLMRGLIEQTGAGRSQIYLPTIALLQHFGITSIEQLPQYEETKKTLQGLLGTTAS